jgi:hypothetical protein
MPCAALSQEGGATGSPVGANGRIVATSPNAPSNGAGGRSRRRRRCGRPAREPRAGTAAATSSHHAPRRNTTGGELRCCRPSIRFPSVTQLALAARTRTRRTVVPARAAWHSFVLRSPLVLLFTPRSRVRCIFPRNAWCVRSDLAAGTRRRQRRFPTRPGRDDARRWAWALTIRPGVGGARRGRRSQQAVGRTRQPQDTSSTALSPERT